MLKIQPPKRVPFCAITGTVKVVPSNSNTPMPQGLVTRNSALPSPSKSPAGPNLLSAVLSSQPPKRVPLGLQHAGPVGGAGEAEHADAPGAGEDHLAPAVAVEVGDDLQPVVVGVEQPAVEAAAVRLERERGEGAAALLERADPPGAADGDIAGAVAIEVGGGDEGRAVDRDAPGAAPAGADVDVGVAVEEGFEMGEERAREMRAERVVGARIGDQPPAVAAVERKEDA